MDPKFKILIFNPNHKLVKNQKQVQIEFVKCESFNQFDLKTSVYAKIYLDLEMN